MPNGGGPISLKEFLKKNEPVSNDDFRTIVRVNLAHLRTPLTGMMGYLAMMSQGDFGKLDATNKKIIDDLLLESQRLIVIVNELMELGKLPKAATSTHHVGGSKKFKILHFEDDNFLTRMYSTKFGMSSITYKSYPDPTNNPIEVVLHEKPDLILMGIIMPKMDGIKATKLIKGDQRTKDIPIIGFDNLGQPGDRESFMQAGMSDYWVFAEHTPTDVINKVRKLFNLPILPDKPIPPPSEPPQSLPVGAQPPDKPKSWWQKFFG